MGLAEGDSWGGAVAVRSSASIAAVSAMVDIPVAEDHGIVIGLESSGIIRRFELCVILVILYKALDEGFVKGGGFGRENTVHKRPRDLQRVLADDTHFPLIGCHLSRSTP